MATRSSRPAGARLSREFKVTVWLTLLHLPLGIALYNVGSVSILHPVAVLFLGVYWATQRRIPINQVALVVAYLVGVEVLWRMAKVPIFWEIGKYGTVLIMVLALYTRGLKNIPSQPVAYFLVLLPSCVLTFFAFDAATARSQISGAMSGPLALAISCVFFSNLRMTTLEVRRTFTAMVIPLISVAAVTFFYSVSNENLQFTTESNFATSGGFGPNQVSSMLGLGVFAAAVAMMAVRDSRRVKIFFGAAAIFLAAQSVLTFSRGGMYNAVLGIAALAVFQFRDVTSGLRKMVPIVLIGLIFLFVIFPQLNNFTGGMLGERFEETGTTHRADIVQTDFDIFLQNPVLGIGVGVSNQYRALRYEMSSSSHTEFSRLLSEHGLLGIVALLALGMTIVLNIKRQGNGFGRALSAGAAVWCIAYMLGAGMRLAAPSFLWGLTFLTIVSAGRPVRRPAAGRPNHA
jgi:O-antigen ligase